jgi:hypothetical protein
LLHLSLRGAIIKQIKSPERGDGATQTLQKMKLCEQYHCGIVELSIQLGLYNTNTKKSKVVFTTDSFVVAGLDSGDAIFIVRAGKIISPIVLLQRIPIDEQKKRFIDSIPVKIMKEEDLSERDVERIAYTAQIPQETLWPKTVRRTAKGWCVTSIKKMLNQHGYHVDVTDSFDLQTETAVKDFQLNNRLYADGIVGGGTRAALLKQGVPEKKGWVPEGAALGVSIVKDAVTRQDKDLQGSNPDSLIIKIRKKSLFQ